MSNLRTRLEALLGERILVLDGAMGTMIQRHTLTEEEFRGERFKGHSRELRGNNDMLVLTRPDVILGIHEQYLEAGADIIETNTFSSTSIAMADYRCESIVREINLAAVGCARRAAKTAEAATPGRRCFVAGAIGPLNRTLSMSPDVNRPDYRAVSWDQVVASYTEQINALLDGGGELRQRLGRARLPALVLWGEQDTLVPPAHGSAYAAGLPDARLVVLPGVGHYPYLEAPAAFAAEIERFASRVPELV